MNVYRVQRGRLEDDGTTTRTYHTNSYIADSAQDACSQDDRWYSSYDTHGGLLIVRVDFVCKLNEVPEVTGELSNG